MTDTAPSLRDSLEETYEKLESGEAPAEAIEVSEAPEASDPVSSDRPIRERDPQSGKFTKASDVGLPSDPKVESPEALAPETEALPEVVTAPRSFSPEERESFSKLPPEMKSALMRLEDSQYKTFTRKMGEIGVRERKYREIDDLIAPYETAWAKAGATPASILRGYMAWEQDYNQNPKEVILDLLSQKGLSVNDLVDNAESEAASVRELKQRIQQLEGYIAGHEQSSIAQNSQNLDHEIGSFRNEVGQDGKPLRPHFDTVYSHMVPIAEVYRRANPDAPNRQIMEAAYRDACRLHPEVYKQTLDQELKQRESQRLREESEKLKKARLAGSSLTGAPNGSSMVSTQPKSLRESLERNWDAMSS